jgi:hypothetical protein
VPNGARQGQTTSKDRRRVLGLLIVGCVASACLLAVLAPCGVVVLNWVKELRSKPSISEVTDPLDAGVVTDICQRFSLSPQDPRCQAGAQVYAVDFFDLPRRAFQPGVTTYADVHAKLGPYEYQCRKPEWNSNGTWTFRCYFDFKGDRTYKIIIRFVGTDQSNGVVDAILLDAGDTP